MKVKNFCLKKVDSNNKNNKNYVSSENLEINQDLQNLENNNSEVTFKFIIVFFWE